MYQHQKKRYIEWNGELELALKLGVTWGSGNIQKTLRNLQSDWLPSDVIYCVRLFLMM